ncbi:MAG: acetamidase/formamidase family protein [Bryobacteraceae bacterium]
MPRLVPIALCFGSVLVAETVTVYPEKYFNSFDHRHPVLRRIKPGDTVVTRTADASGRDYTGNPVASPSNPLTGPFYVEGAEPGDALLIRFDRMRLNRNWGYTGHRLGLFALTPEYIERIYPRAYREGAAYPGRNDVLPWDLDIEKQTVKLREPTSKVMKFEFPARPMLGCVGVAAPGVFGPTSGISGNYGGNMDYNEVVEGATVWLPVFHSGGLLFVGDGHALQGDGEPTGNGIETSMNVTMTIQVKKRANIAGPRLENADYIVAIGSQPEFVSSLDHTQRVATVAMIDWLVNEYKLEPWAAHQLIGFQGKLDVITVGGSMGLRIPKKVLPK